MQISLIRENEILTQMLPDKAVGQFSLCCEIDGKSDRIISVEAINGKWFLKSGYAARIISAGGEYLKNCELTENTFQKIEIRSSNEIALVYAESVSRDRASFQKVIFPTVCSISIGRDASNGIVYSNRFASSSHARINCDKGKLSIEDLDSVNGTFVNGRRIRQTDLEIGDVIYIVGLKIIVGKGLLAVNNPDSRVHFDKRLLTDWRRQLPNAERALEDESDSDNEEDQTDLFFRSPRFRRDIKTAVIRIDPPPSASGSDEIPILLLLGPSITMGLASISTAVFSINNVLSTGGKISSAMPTLVMSMSMLLGTMLWPSLSKRYEKKRKMEREKTRQEKYSKYLEEIRLRVNDECKYQAEILNENFKPVDDCIGRIRMRTRNLWERSIAHVDFCTVRIGIGNLPLNIDIKYAERKFTMDDDNLQDEMLNIGEAPKILKDVPITVSLVKDNILGITGSENQAGAFLKALIFQLSALHSYDELKFVFIIDKNKMGTWEFVRWLPHIWDNGKTTRFIATDPIEGKELSAFLENEWEKRSNLSENELKYIVPHYVIFAFDKSIAEKMEAIDRIMKNRSQNGFSIIANYEKFDMLPKECTKVIDLDGETAKLFDKNDITGVHIDFKADLFNGDAESVAEELANIQLNTAYSAKSLPNMLTFLEMFGVGKIEHLNILNRWKENDPTKTLETAVGVDGMGEIIKLDLHEKYHGPHGLVAGMTGSGKSEFIITYILSLAINYHPNEVAFILIDYKGGGMAKAFENLPHTAGIITNLDGAAVTRSLISIQSELIRRQGIFNRVSKEINVSNIDIYKYQKLYRDGVVSEPLPHLFIISDEFAELKTQQPEFMHQLVSAARIGRSLGVHLILATQKPSGVVDDQIWSNSKFRVCLKVQEKADSMDMLKRSEAAELSTTGRFYLQVGYNELFKLGQSAWAGAPYYPSDRLEKQQDNSVTVIDNLGKIIKRAAFDKKRAGNNNPPKQIDEITKYLAEIAAEEKIRVRPMWLEAIPAHIYVDELQVKYDVQPAKNILRPIVGEIDDPANQRQLVMQLPISEEGNTIIYGVTGSGKTTFLTTMIYSLIKNHTPEEVSLYLLDFGSETLKGFAKAPQVGDVLFADEKEKLVNLFKMLTEEIGKRKKMFSDYGGDYRAYLKESEEKLEAIVVVIQNYSGFSENYADLEEPLTYLTREGSKYGIYFIVTSTSTNAIRYRLQQNFKQMILLQLNDTSEYSGLIGNTDGVYPSKFKGRGILKTDRVYEFQTAEISKDENSQGLIRQYCSEIACEWKRGRARKIPILPDKVDVEYFSDYLSDMKLSSCPIGIEKNSLKVSCFNFDAAYIHLVLSQGSENLRFLAGLSELITAANSANVTVLDGSGSLSQLEACESRIISGSKPLNDTVVELFFDMLNRNNTAKDSIEKGESVPAFAKSICIISSISELMSQLTEDGRDKLKVLLEKGEASYNYTFIIGENTSGLSSVTIETWYKKHVTSGDGIWVGSGLTDQYQMKITKLTNDLYDEVDDDFGYTINKGKPTRIKLLTVSADRMEAGE